MLKIGKLLGNQQNYFSSSSFRHQFKLKKPYYYPKRSLSEEDELQIPVQKSNPDKEELGPRAFDLYRILGVAKNATTQEIKTAYYELAKKYHPDAKPTPKETEMFRKISEAYHILSDENIRTEYDRRGVMLINKQQTKILPEAHRRNMFKFLKEYPMTIDKNNSRMTFIGSNLKSVNNEVELKLKFQEAVLGSTKYIDLKAMAKCYRCNGATKVGSGTNVEFCPKCGGTGRFRDKSNNSIEHKCDTCDGRCYINKNTCKACENRGHIVHTKRVEVIVPEGTSDGDTLKINNPINNQILSIKVNVEKSSQFQCNGKNVLSDKYLTISQAILGGIVKIRGLYEDFEVNLEPGVESHTTQCFKGRGIRTKTGLIGNHIVTFKIRIPKKLTTKQRQIVLAFSRDEDPIFDGQ